MRRRSGARGSASDGEVLVFHVREYTIARGET
jgi:hypothetical protein